MLTFGTTNTSLLNNIGQQLHSLLLNKEILNEGALMNDEPSISIFMLVYMLLCFFHLEQLNFTAATHRHTHSIAKAPGKVIPSCFLVTYQKLGYNERGERSGCRELLYLLSLFRQFNPLGTFDLTTSKYTLPYSVLLGIDFRKGGDYYPQNKMTLSKTVHTVCLLQEGRASPPSTSHLSSLHSLSL